MNRVIFFGLAAAATLVAFLLGRLSIPAELYGWDSYPLIAASRFDSVGAFFGTFTEELMDGRYPKGSFYRPVLHLMLGGEHAVFGLAPTGYGAVSVAAAVLAAVGVGLAALRSGFHAIGAALALAFVLLHPVADNVVWFMPRRPESLSLLFIAATLMVQRRGETPKGWRLWATGVFALLAAASKESGALVVPILWTLHASTSLRSATRAAWPAIAAVAAFVAVRTAVLGGMGGHPESSISNLAGVGAFALGQLRLVLGGGAESFPWILLPLTAGAAVLLAGSKDPVRRAAVFVPLVWLAGHFALSSLSGVERDWYAYQVLAPLGWLVGGLVTAALAPAEGASAAARGATVVLAVAGVIALVLPILRADAPLNRASIDGAARLTLDKMDALTKSTPVGRAAVLQGWTQRVELGPSSIFLHAPYSLEAYAELIGAPRTTVVRGQRPLDPERITILLRR